MEKPIVVCVQNDPLDSLGIAPRLLRAAGCETRVLRAFEGEGAWPSAGSLGGLVVFGGEMNADQLDRYPYLRRARDLVRQSVDLGVPTLGICLGPQLLARAFDARVYRAPVRELGFVSIQLTAAGRSDPLLAACRPGDRFFEWHEDTFDLPLGATLLASGRAVQRQAFRIGSAWGIQFHPEVDAAEIRQWVETAGGSLESAWGRTRAEVTAEAQDCLPAQEDRAGLIFAAFAREVMARARR
jgi:GMP synthase (glutamine-hydrolysing)